MYRRILVPLDGSETADAILPHVEGLAKELEAEVVLVRVIAPTEAAFGESSRPIVPQRAAALERQRYEEEQDEARRHLGARKAGMEVAGLRARSEVIEGDAAEAILDHAARTGASLIAMSTRGRGGLGRLLLGSVTEEVLRKSSTPMFLVRAGSEQSSPRD